MIFILLTLGKKILILFLPFHYFGQVTVVLLCLGKACHDKQSKPSPFDKKFKNHALDLAQVIVNDSISQN